MALVGQVVTNDYQGRHYKVSWTATQNLVNNTSKVDWTLEALGGTSSWYAETILRVYVDGGAAVYNKTNRVERRVGTIASGSKTLNHNDAGIKSFIISIEAATYVSTINLTGSKTFALDNIGRNSTINWIPEITAEGNFTVNLTRSPAAASHVLGAYIGSQQIKVWTGYESGTNTFNATDQSAIYQALPNSKSATITFKLWTYSDLGRTKQIGDVSIRNTTIHLTKGATCSLHTAAYNVVNSTMIEGVSRPIFEIRDIVTSPHATIKSYSISSSNYFNVSRDYYEAGPIPTGITTLQITARVTDSRDNVAIATRNFEVVPYNAPSISRFEVYRSTNTGGVDPSGTYARVHISATVASLLNTNTISWRLYSKPRGTTIWGSAKATGSAETSLNVSRTLSTYDTTQSYDFMLEITDRFNTTMSLGTLSTAGYAMSWGKDGVGIGKVQERGKLDIGGDTYINENAIHSEKSGEFLSHRSSDLRGWMTWYDRTWVSAQVGLLDANSELFTIKSDYDSIELDARRDITLTSNRSSATFYNGVFEPVQESTLTLYSGWTRRSDFAPVKAIKTVDGMVHLQGVLQAGTTSAGTDIFRLPVGMRPEDTIILMAWNTDDTVRRYDIDKYGYMTTYRTAGPVIPLNGMSFYVGA